MSFGKVKQQEIASGAPPGKGLSLDSLGDRMLAMTEIKRGSAQFGLPPEESDLALGAEDAIGPEAIEVAAATVVEGEVIEGEVIEADEGATASVPERRRYERASTLR